MVEFALVLLPFLLATIGVIEIGRAWSVKQGLTNAAREGTRVLILPYGTDRSCPDIDCTSATSLQDAALQTTRYFLANAGISPDTPTTDIIFIKQQLRSDGSVTTEPLTTAPQSGDLVGIKITYHYSSVIQGFINEETNLFDMGSTSVMRHE